MNFIVADCSEFQGRFVRRQTFLSASISLRSLIFSNWLYIIHASSKLLNLYVSLKIRFRSTCAPFSTEAFVYVNRKITRSI
jgi:hypothetical protein